MPHLSIDVYEPGHDVTARATAAVTGNHFVRVTGTRADGLLVVGPAAPAGRVCGVAKYTAAAGEVVGLARGAARIVRVKTGAALTAGTEVEVGTDGTAVPATTGVPVGYTVDTAGTGTLAAISLYA